MDTETEEKLNFLARMVARGLGGNSNAACGTGVPINLENLLYAPLTVGRFPRGERTTIDTSSETLTVDEEFHALTTGSRSASQGVADLLGIKPD